MPVVVHIDALDGLTVGRGSRLALVGDLAELTRLVPTGRRSRGRGRSGSGSRGRGGSRGRSRGGSRGRSGGRRRGGGRGAGAGAGAGAGGGAGERAGGGAACRGMRATTPPGSGSVGH